MSDACGCGDDEPRRPIKADADLEQEEAEEREPERLWEVSELRFAAVAGMFLLAAFILDRIAPERSTEVVRLLAAEFGARLPVIAVGGIETGADAAAKIAAGAVLVQLYTGFVYRGPGLVSEAVAATGRAAASTS